MALRTVDAATMHVLIVSDTLEETIGPNAFNDSLLIQCQMDRIARLVGMRYEGRLLQGAKVTVDNLLRVIKGLRVRRDDALFCFFAGHGFNHAEEAQRRWPLLYFSQQGEAYPFELVAQALARKKARLLVLCADSCNNLLEEYERPPVVTRAVAALRGEASAPSQAFIELFTGWRGTVWAVAARRGGYAFAELYGNGFFTKHLFGALDVARGSDAPLCWETLLQQVTLKLPSGQTPDFCIMPSAP